MPHFWFNYYLGVSAVMETSPQQELFSADEQDWCEPKSNLNMT